MAGLFEVMIERNFSSAHQLRGYRGKCENLRGHNYRVEIYARGEELNNISCSPSSTRACAPPGTAASSSRAFRPAASPATSKRRRTFSQKRRGLTRGGRGGARGPGKA